MHLLFWTSIFSHTITTLLCADPIRIIDIFTNYPNTAEVLKEYDKIQKDRLLEATTNYSSRSYHDPYYNTHYKPDFYGDRRSYYAPSSSGDVLESEFGVFEGDSNGYNNKYNDFIPETYNEYTVKPVSYSEHSINIPQTMTGNSINNYNNEQTISHETYDEPHTITIPEVYNKPQTYNEYTIINPQTPNESEEDFKTKLHKLVTRRPNFLTRHNVSDQLNFSNDYESNELDIQSEYGEIIPKPTRPPKKGIILPVRRPYRKTTTTESPMVMTRQRITNIIRNYLVNMHRKKEKKSKRRPLLNTSANSKLFDITSVHTNVDTSIKLEEGVAHQKYLTSPIESIKNKTMKFANKFLSLFTVIQFANARCQATSALSAYEGTCFLASECKSMNGVAMGNCAEGHGVCCVFRGTCGGVGTNNCTYFESPNYPNYYPEGGVLPPNQVTSTTINPLTPDPRFQILHRQGRQATSDLANALSCIYRVYKTSDAVKQMRLDFIDLELRGPRNGTCVDERLVIAGTNLNTMVPTLCGYLTGQHVYVDVSSLSGPLQISVLANAIERKRYKIRICQYSDGCSGMLNCLQYYTGLTGTITSFNYDQAASFSRSTPQYLNNLNYAICIKREPGYCTVTYTNTANGVQYPFQLRNLDDDGMVTVPNGQAGVGVINCPDDYIVINGIRLCGDRLNDGSVNENFSANAPVTDFSGGPIIIPVRTNGASNGRGFKLFYTQNRCTSMGGGGGVPDPRQRRSI